ncbi:hypothetical protein TWF718_005721 [Orbilia javanica]|uniref:Uncharacterized protein n=1 Tax=Orbilia javanica TaxID=47235 RepID=A0AAN8NXH1_9PEZI
MFGECIRSARATFCLSSGREVLKPSETRHGMTRAGINRPVIVLEPAPRSRVFQDGDWIQALDKI